MYVCKYVTSLFLCLFLFVYDKFINVEMDRCGCVLIDHAVIPPHQSRNLGNWGSVDIPFHQPLGSSGHDRIQDMSYRATD